MSTEFTIKEAKRTDYLHVKRFIELVDTDFYPPLSERGGGIPERVQKCLDTPEANYLIARLNKPDLSDSLGGIIGMIGCTRDWKGKDSAYVNFLATHPRHRNHGVSKGLTTRYEEIMAEQNIRKIYLCTWSSNPAAMKFYEDRGYKAYVVVLDDRGNGVDTIYYKKNINI